MEQICVAKDFPLTRGETLRVKLPGSRAEIRIKVGTNVSGDNSTTKVFKAEDYFYPGPGTNKQPISIVNDPTRKLPRSGSRGVDWRGWDCD